MIMDKPHRPPPYMDRSFTGSQAMWARKSVEEAPEVSNYDYGNVGTFEGLDSMTTDFGLLGQDQHSTSIYGHVGKEKVPTYDTNVLLNDAFFCIITDDGGKLYEILTTLQRMGIRNPADHPYTTMFGSTCLWEKVHDDDIKIPKRYEAVELLKKFHNITH